MNNRKTSVVWMVSREEFQRIIDESHAMVEVLKKLGLQTETGNHRTLIKRIKEDHISLEKFLENKRIFLENKRLEKEIPIENILVENSSYGRKRLKERLVRNNLLEYKCEKCGNEGFWQGKPISLQIDHKNGINNDNRINNLCFLCPNCHSQTETYGGKRKKIHNLCKCGKEITKKSVYCGSCASQIFNEKNRKIPNITKEELEKLISEMPIVKIAEKFGVSDNAVRKLAKRIGIHIKSISRYCHKNHLEQ